MEGSIFVDKTTNWIVTFVQKIRAAFCEELCGKNFAFTLNYTSSMRTVQLKSNCRQGKQKRTDPNPSHPVKAVLAAAVAESEQMSLIGWRRLLVLWLFRFIQ